MRRANARCVCNNESVKNQVCKRLKVLGIYICKVVFDNKSVQNKIFRRLGGLISQDISARFLKRSLLKTKVFLLYVENQCKACQMINLVQNQEFKRQFRFKFRFPKSLITWLNFNLEDYNGPRYLQRTNAGLFSKKSVQYQVYETRRIRHKSKVT